MKSKEQISTFLAQEHLMVTARGTSGLWLALSVLEPTQRGVLVPANVCEVVIAAIFFAGLEPIYVDVDPIVGNFSVRHLEESPYHKAGILLAVHNFGTPLPIQDICDWAHARQIFVIEDACNALGAEADGNLVGVIGDAAIYSFGGSKIVDIGYGGLLAARDPTFLNACRDLDKTLDAWSNQQRQRDIAFQDCLRTLRRHPELKDPAIYRVLYRQYKPALVARAVEGLTDVIAKGLLGLSINLDVRRRRADFYRERLNHPAIIHRPPQSGEVCWRYICHLPSQLRDGATRYLIERELPISTWYPAVDRLFRERPASNTLPGVDSFERTVINLWVEPTMKDDVVERSSVCLIEYIAEELGE